jgi:phosphoribosyl-AMP cyclohydrolase
MTLPIDFKANPLIPAVIQDDSSRDVLMVGFMNQLAYEMTLETGYVHFWSRSRNQLWKKGETSGHTQEVVSMSINCEENSLLVLVVQTGAVCHTGHSTCFYRQILPDGSLFETSDPVFDPDAVYESKQRAEPAHDGARSIGVWYGAYEYLARQPLQEVSGTSRLFHQDARPFDRIADELEELAGVLAGTHSHSGDVKNDVTLEGSQVLYWLNVLAIGSAQEWDRDLELEKVMFPPHDFSERSERTIPELRDAATTWRIAGARLESEHDAFMKKLPQELCSTYWLVARAVSPVVKPFRLVEHDLDELKSKLYLTDYFASVGV